MKVQMNQRLLAEEYRQTAINDALEEAYEDAEADSTEEVEAFLQGQIRSMTPKNQPVEEMEIEMNIELAHENTRSVEDVLNQIELDYRLVPLLKLKGTVTYMATRLVIMYLAKTAKVLADNKTEGHPLDDFASAMAYLRSQPDEDLLMEQMGLEVNTGMWATAVALIKYSNKLNMLLQDVMDPPTTGFPMGRKRTQEGARWKPGFGITTTALGRKQQWTEGLRFHKDPEDPLAAETYEDFVALTKGEDPNGDFVLSRAEWEATQTDTSLATDYSDTIVDVLMNAADGTDEADFDELPERTQIALIEKMRTKLPDMVVSAFKRINTSQRTKSEKAAECMKQRGLIMSLDSQLIDMLDSPRYAPFVEFMYSYQPAGPMTEELETREMRARQEDAADRSNARRRLTAQEIARQDQQDQADEALGLPASEV